MAPNQEAARVVEQGISSEIPDWDLTVDFLQDMPFDFECGNQDGVGGSPWQMSHNTPADSIAQGDHPIPAGSDTDVLKPVLSNSATPEQRKLHNNRIAQARARKRRKVFLNKGRVGTDLFATFTA